MPSQNYMEIGPRNKWARINQMIFIASWIKTKGTKVKCLALKCWINFLMKPAVQERTSRILHKTAPAERCQMLPCCWLPSSSLAHNSSHLQWPQSFLWSYVRWHNIPMATNYQCKFPDEKQNSKGEIELLFGVTSNTTKIVAEPPAPSNSTLSKFAFKY